MVYCGNPGIGKTFLCAGFIEWGMKEFRSFRYYNERQIFTKLREAIDKGWDCNAELRRLLDDDLVILDDVGSTGVNEWRSDILFDIVDFRYNLMLPTVFTSNFCYKEFREKYHPRLTSRLFAKENTIIQIESGVDFRQQ